MVSTRILRVRVLDSPQDHVVIRVDSGGPGELDLQIWGTDEVAAFTGRVDHGNFTGFRSKQVQMKDSDWARALTILLAPVDNGSALPPPPAGELELAARVEDGCMTLIVREKVQGITRRLGEITLREDEETEIRLFEWTAVAALATDRLQEKVLNLTADVERQQRRVASLQTQLDELTSLKSEHEDALLEKCARLLNSKKLKIRDQQRLLARAKIDPLTATDGDSRNRSSKDSGPLKRKADEDDDDLENDDVDDSDHDDRDDDDGDDDDDDDDRNDDDDNDDDDDDVRVSESEPETGDGHADGQRNLGRDEDFDDETTDDEL